MAMAGLSAKSASVAVFGVKCAPCLPFQAARALPACNQNLYLGGRCVEMVTSLRLPWGPSKRCSKFANSRIVCQASNEEKVTRARKFQLEATELLAELLKANDVKSIAQEHVESLSEDFFIIASTYLDLAKKEGNVEVVSKLETTLQTALQVKEATLRPEIRLLNQLLRETAENDRTNTIGANVQYLSPDSYFFQLLSRMINDVESQKGNPNRLRLLTQLRMINKETREVAKSLRKKEHK